MAFQSIDQTEPVYPDFPQGIQVVAPNMGIMNIDCSGNPNYPAAVWGNIYIVTVAGKIGGSAGIDVEIGNLLFSNAINPSGDQATVGGHWTIFGELGGSMGTATTTVSIPASEVLTSGDLVNIWNSTGAKVRRATASVANKEAHGFVISNYNPSDVVTVYLEGTNLYVAGLTPGVQFLSATAGLCSDTAPASKIIQRVGLAIDATTLFFQPEVPFILST
jgi:hypothetical protein